MFNLELYKFGTIFKLYIVDNVGNTEIEKDINSLFISYEKVFSRFDKTSELSILNKKNRGELSSLFLDLFFKNIDLNQITKGYFNLFIDVDAIGYSKKDKINIDTEVKTISFNDNYKLEGNILYLLNNSKIDFGGSGKGYFVDYINNYLKDKGYKNYFINFGGDIFISGTKEGNNFWRIGIENPFLKGEKIGYINLKDKSISSSGNYLKNWSINGKKYHHIINPINNSNENEIKMVTIISDKTYFSDSIATSVFNMGIKEGILFLNENNIDGLIIGDNAKAYFSKGFIDKYSFSKEY